MNDPLRKLLTAVNRTLSFPARARNYFFLLLQEYYASNFAPLETFTHMEKSALNRAVRNISKLSRGNIYRSRPFATGYAASCYFTELEETLLKLGERYAALPRVTRIIVRTDAFRAIPFTITKDSLQWIAIIIIVLWMSNSSASGLRRIAGDYGWFFDVAEIFMSYVLPGALLAVCLSPVYLWLRASPWEIRQLLFRLGFFRMHASITEYRVLSVLKELTATNIPAADVMDLLLGVFRSERWLTVRIRRAKAQLRTRTYLEALQHVISPAMYSHILAAAPNHQPEEIANGMDSACAMLEMQLDHTVSIARNAATLATSLASFGVMLPFMLITLGAAGGDEFFTGF